MIIIHGPAETIVKYAIGDVRHVRIDDTSVQYWSANGEMCSHPIVGQPRHEWSLDRCKGALYSIDHVHELRASHEHAQHKALEEPALCTP